MLACLDQAYAALPEEAARLYRRLGLHPGPEFGHEVALSVAGAEPAVPDPARQLTALVEAGLLAVPGPGRRRFPDPVQRHAREHAESDDPEPLRRAVAGRLVRHYLTAADRADLVLNPRHRPAPDPAAPAAAPTASGDPAAALAWLDLEGGNIVAVQRLADAYGMADATWRLADAMWGLHRAPHHREDWIATYELGAAAARSCGDRPGQARLLDGLGVALRRAGRHDEALRALDEALALHRESGDRRGEALVLHTMALAHRDRGELDRTLSLLIKALALQDGSSGPDEAAIEHHLGLADLRAGDRAAAREHLATALDLLAPAGDVHAAGAVHETLAALDERDGDPAAARDHYARAAAVYARLGAAADAERAAAHVRRLGGDLEAD